MSQSIFLTMQFLIDPEKSIYLEEFHSYAGNTTKDPNNKMEVVMKLMRANGVKKSDLDTALSYKMEVRVYKGLKKGQYFEAFQYDAIDSISNNNN